MAWNENSITALTDSLNGKRSSIQIRFNEANSSMSLVCQIQSNIRITLFQIILTKIQEQSPLSHMKHVFLSYRMVYQQQENKLKYERDRMGNEMKETVALGKQIQEQTQYEVIQMKKKFADLVNQCKKQLRRQIKEGVLEINQEEEEVQERNIRKRPILRVNQEVLESQRVQKSKQRMEIQDNGSEKKGFEDIFD